MRQVLVHSDKPKAPKNSGVELKSFDAEIARRVKELQEFKGEK